MPRKRRILREHILDAALNLMKEEGFNHFTARRIANYLNASTQPIYKEFENMDDLKENLLNYIKEILEEKIFQLHEEQSDLEVVCTNYIRFATKKGTLFSALFMDREFSVTTLHDYINQTLHLVMQRTEGLQNINLEDRQSLLDIMWPSVHGLAVLTSQNQYTFTEEEIEEKVTHILTHSIQAWENRKVA